MKGVSKSTASYFYLRKGWNAFLLHLGKQTVRAHCAPGSVFIYPGTQEFRRMASETPGLNRIEAQDQGWGSVTSVWGPPILCIVWCGSFKSCFFPRTQSTQWSSWGGAFLFSSFSLCHSKPSLACSPYLTHGALCLSRISFRNSIAILFVGSHQRRRCSIQPSWRKPVEPLFKFTSNVTLEKTLSLLILKTHITSPLLCLSGSFAYSKYPEGKWESRMCGWGPPLVPLFLFSVYYNVLRFL